MARFIPRDKLSKKARRQLDNQKRLTWTYPPVAKVFKSKKDYDRRQKSHDDQQGW
ncbi:MAG: hypothetical protein IIZ39_15125 [Blautia sp.]|nr:hypothetical protein [Blautia sp.]